jgi:chorismate mutase
MTVCRGIRGATIAEENTAQAIYAAAGEMLAKLVDANKIEERDVAAVYFTTTPDLNAGFPAAAARQMGWNNTALMGSSEIDVPGSLSRCIRVLILVNTDLEADQLVNIYLNGTDVLRLSGVDSQS